MQRDNGVSSKADLRIYLDESGIHLMSNLVPELIIGLLERLKVQVLAQPVNRPVEGMIVRRMP